MSSDLEQVPQNSEVCGNILENIPRSLHLLSSACGLNLIFFWGGGQHKHCLYRRVRVWFMWQCFSYHFPWTLVSLSDLSPNKQTCFLWEMPRALQSADVNSAPGGEQPGADQGQHREQSRTAVACSFFAVSGPLPCVLKRLPRVVKEPSQDADTPLNIKRFRDGPSW